MADVITRFKLETTQYDSKLRDASRQLAEYAREANYAGKEFDTFSKEQEDAARSLGSIATSAKTAKEKVGELVNAYNTVAKAYNKLTEEQRQSDYGKAMAESLNTLKGRIGEAKKELHDLGNEGERTGGIMDELSKKFTINIDAMKLLDIGLKAVNGALSVAKDAFFANEQNLDEWGRTVKSSESLYKGFLNALNTGDITSYLNNINNIVSAARAAYDALDELATFNAFNQMNNSKARTDFMESINNYRENGGAPYSDYLVKLRATTYKNELGQRQFYEQRAYNAEIARVAAERGVSAQDLKDALSGTWGNYKSLKALPLSGTRSVLVNSGGTYASGPQYNTVTERYAANRAEELGQALRELNDTELKYLQGLGAAAQNTGFEIEGINRQLNRVMRSGNGSANGGGSGGPVGGGNNTSSNARELTGLIEIQEAKIKDLRTAWQQAATKEGIEEYRRELIMANIELDELKGKGIGGISISGILSEKLRGDQAAFREKKLDTRIVERQGQTVSVGQTLGSLAGGMNQIAGGIEQLGIDIPEGFNKAIGVMQAVAAILTGISTVVTIIAAIQGTKAVPIIGWALARGGVVKAAGGYQVPGNNYSNDMVPALLNSGELVLNKAQQGNLAAQLSGGQGGYAAQPYVNGEMILLGTNNYLGRSGQGEVVTTKMLKSMGLMK